MRPRTYHKSAVFPTSRDNARRTRLDDVDLARLDSRLLTAQLRGNPVPKGLAKAVTEEVNRQSAEALAPENRVREPGRALLWMMHLQEREAKLLALKDKQEQHTIAS